jgi:methylmalonyl-CoA mutase N-terminal domain/subunit
VESLTNEIEAKAWEFLHEIEEKGGYIACLESGFLLNKVITSALKAQQNIDSGRKVIVGVNKYVSEEQPPTPLKFFRHREETPKKAVENIIRLKKERDNNKTRKALSGLHETLVKGDNIVRPMIEASKAYATLGEIAGVCREVLGEYVPIK